MTDLPAYITLVFIACVIATFGFIYYAVARASDSNENIPVVLTTFFGIWVFVISLLSIRGFFQNFEAWPPRIFIGVFILLGLIIGLFIHKPSRAFILKMPITTLTYIHIIRVPVEIVLWWIYLHGMVDVSMTFEGSNYDILSGISAPFAGLFLVGMRSKSKISAIIWNFICLGLLFNIVGTAILSTPYFFSPDYYDQPNTAVFYFPYIFLPLFIVPVVLFAHIASLLQLFLKMDTDDEDDDYPQY